MVPNKTGFTLIELLIVVLIISILAAIAVPNLVQAQSKAQVSRIKADMRSMANALESYNVDWEDFPTPDGPNGLQVAAGYTPSFYETRLPQRLTTPISYFGRLMQDPFETRASGTTKLDPYHYSTRRYAKNTTSIDGGVRAYDSFAQSNFMSNVGQTEWYVLSHGPDQVLDASEQAVRIGDPANSTYAPYDPTNGAQSSGDLVYFGSSNGFKQ